MIFVITLGVGASLSPRDFPLAFRRPYGLMVGVVSHYGLMPLIGFLLALSLLMTAPSTGFGILLIPTLLVLYAGALDVDIPRESVIATLILLLVPVGLVWCCASSTPIQAS